MSAARPAQNFCWTVAGGRSIICRMKMATFVFTLALAVGLVSPAWAQADMSGGWTLTFQGPQGPVDAAATFKQDGEKIYGHADRPAGRNAGDRPIKEKAFTFLLAVQTQQGEMSIKIAGEVDGDALKGTFDFGQGTGEFTGKRKAK